MEIRKGRRKRGREERKEGGGLGGRRSGRGWRGKRKGKIRKKVNTLKL